MKKFAAILVLLMLSTSFMACGSPKMQRFVVTERYLEELSDVSSPDEAPELDIIRCDDCRDIGKEPYQPRHDGKYEDGVFWELPVKHIGHSPDIIFETNKDAELILVVDNYEQLNSLRIRTDYWGDISRPIAHNYTPEFFETSALILINDEYAVSSRWGLIRRYYLSALLTDSQYFYPVFENYYPAGTYTNFFLEIDRTIVDNYEIGSAYMHGIQYFKEDHSNAKINWLCGKCEGGWDFSPSGDWGISIGEDDSVLVKRDFQFSTTLNGLQWESDIYGHDIYIKRPNSDEFEYLFLKGNRHVYLNELDLDEGINTIKAVTQSIKYCDGQYVQEYDYFELEVAEGHLEKDYNFNVSVLHGNSSMHVFWNSSQPHKVYVQRPNSQNYELISRNGYGSNGIDVESFGFLAGTNNIMVETYEFKDGKAIKITSSYSLIFEGEKRQVFYDFRLVGGGIDEVNGGHGITWDGGDNQFYERYIKKAGSNDFKYFNKGPRSWQILLYELNLNEGKHILRIEGWQFSEGALRKIYSDFDFVVKNKEKSDVKFAINKGSLKWDYNQPWDIHSVFVKHAGSDTFVLKDSWATGGFGFDYFGTDLTNLELTKGENIIEVHLAWAQYRNVLIRTVAHCRIIVI